MHPSPFVAPERPAPERAAIAVTVCKNERWWQLEDGTLVFLGGCGGDEYGVIIAPGDEPPEIHTRQLPSNVVQLHG